MALPSCYCALLFLLSWAGWWNFYPHWDSAGATRNFTNFHHTKYSANDSHKHNSSNVPDWSTFDDLCFSVLQSWTRKRDYDDAGFVHKPDWSIIFSRYLNCNIHLWWLSCTWMWAISDRLEGVGITYIILGQNLVRRYWNMTPLPHPINFVVLLSIRELFNFGSNQNQKMKKKPWQIILLVV